MTRGLLAGCLLAVATLASAADEQVVFQQSANGVRNTRPFTVHDRWELRWDNKGPLLSITIRQADGKLAGGGAMATQPGTGASFEPQGGTYYLAVNGQGDWTVTVVQLP